MSSFDSSHNGTVMTMSHPLFPAPVPITYFPDDTDPFSAANITVADVAMGTNGDLIGWSTAVPIEFTVAVIPKSPAHTYFSTLLNAAAVKKKGILTTGTLVKGITFTRVMPDGTTLIISDAVMTGGTPAMNQSSSGRIATVSYTFKGSPAAEVGIPQV